MTTTKLMKVTQGTRQRPTKPRQKNIISQRGSADNFLLNEQVFVPKPLPVITSIWSATSKHGKHGGVQAVLDPLGRLTILHARCKPEKSELRVSLMAKVQNIKNQSFSIRNNNSVCVELAWVMLKKVKKRKHRCFYIDERNMVIEPGGTKTVAVQFRPKIAGIFLTRYQLVCVERSPSSFTPAQHRPVLNVTLQGYAIGFDIFRKSRRKVAKWLKSRAARRFAQQQKNKQEWQQQQQNQCKVTTTLADEQSSRIDETFMQQNVSGDEKGNFSYYYQRRYC